MTKQEIQSRLAAIQRSEQWMLDIQHQHEETVLQLREEIDELQLQERPSYPNDTILTGLRNIQDMTLEEFDGIASKYKSHPLAPGMLFTVFADRLVVTLDTQAPDSAVTGRKLWGFTAEDVTALLEAFEQHKIRVEQAIRSHDDQRVVLHIHVPWLM